MKNTTKNFRLFFNLLFLSGLVLFFSSCAREKGSVSYNSEKLRKQSMEIENSHSTGTVQKNEVTPKETSKKTVNAENALKNIKAEAKTTNEKPSQVLINKSEPKKMSVAQKAVANKLVKRIESSKAFKNQTKGGIDGDLKLAIIVGIFGLILVILGGISWIFYILGVIAILIALILFLLWVLNQ